MVWQQSDGNIFCPIFINDGTKLNNKFQINNITNSTIENPSIIALKNNNFVVTWDDYGNIYNKIFTGNGSIKMDYN